jgi:hypothetical protein
LFDLLVKTLFFITHGHNTLTEQNTSKLFPGLCQTGEAENDLLTTLPLITTLV